MYKITNSGNSTEILLYSLIEDGITANKLINSLKGFDPEAPLTLRINSDGGEVFEAIALYNVLKDRNLNVIIDGMCSSAASIVAMAGKHILMKRASMMMIHNPMIAVKGDSDKLKDAAALAEKLTQSMADIYSERTGLDREQIISLMASETYFTPADAVRLKFADEFEEGDLPSVPTYQDGIMAERERIKALDELIAPGREELIIQAKYQTGATAKDIAVDILKAEASRLIPAPQINVNGFSASDATATATAIKALQDTISRKRG